MKTDIDLHPIQAEILNILLFNKESRFSDLNKSSISSDHFNFHVKRLLDLELIQKNLNNKYFLTNSGKEYANRLDTETNLIEKQAKVAVRIICTRVVNGTLEILMEQRLKHPFFGYYGFTGGKVKWGETALEGAIRELEEETGLQGKLTFCGIKHKIDYDENNNLLEDKFFFVYKAEDLTGKFKENYEGGKNIWMCKKDILKLNNLFPNVEESLDLLEKSDIYFLESKYLVKDY